MGPKEGQGGRGTGRAKEMGILTGMRGILRLEGKEVSE